MDPVVECYHATKRFPNNEAYGLASQMQRSAVPVPANIAEGREASAGPNLYSICLSHTDRSQSLRHTSKSLRD